MKLGINIDHIATLRNVRGTTYPCPVEAAKIAEQAGADLITVHLREDRRHIKDEDLIEIAAILTTSMNLECAVNAEMLNIACRTKPKDVCLVPEKRQEITTEGGLNVIQNADAIKDALIQLSEQNIRTSIFIDANIAQISKAIELGITCVEIHTGEYADAKTEKERLSSLQKIVQASEFAYNNGLIVNAGHGLHYTNVQEIAKIPQISELNIGHAIIARALFVGLNNAVAEMKNIINNIITINAN
jgi:pyridoxine 5-phosphate synthase